MNLYLIRHGQTDWNIQEIVQGRIDNPLNEVGRNQAVAAGKKLKELNVKFDIIYSSPLARAKESAEIINSILYINDYRVEPDFTEREFGELEGMDCSDMRKLVASIKEKPKGYETDEEIIKRVRTKVDEIVNEGENIIIVCHSHTIKSLLISIDPINYNFMSKLDNTNIVKINYINGKYNILGII